MKSHSFVVQCIKCKTIVGDSNGYENTVDRMVVFSKVTNLELMEKIAKVSASGFDQGCQYLTIQCTRCRSVVGKLYKRVNTDLEKYLDRFCLDTNALTSYVIGSDQEDHVSRQETGNIQNMLINQVDLSNRIDRDVAILKEQVRDLTNIVVVLASKK